MKTVSLLAMLLCMASLTAQSIRVTGTIKDSIGAPLELANVIATEKVSGTMESYAITNYDGKYQLELEKDKSYSLTASFLGFDPQTKEIVVPADGTDITVDFVLKENANQLDGVEIVYEMPVTVRGDTIVYNADSFKRGDERKLEDIMKNLPGVEVSDDGEIQVEGKTVSKVMVEGKDFFDGDSKLAGKNIPADAVDKVEVLRNFNEVSQMRGLGNDQDNIAINIKLKEGKKNFWFGEVTAGVGLKQEEEGAYLIHPKLFYYSPKYSINLITDFNDVGEVPFTFRDYFNFTGGFRNFNNGGGTRFNISESDLGFAVAQNNRANEITAKFLAGNFSYAATKSLDISGFGILSDNGTNIVNNTIRQIVATGAIENTTSTNDQRSQLGMFKASAGYKPSTNLQIDYDVLLKASKQTQTDATLSSVFGEINEDKENTPQSINQNVNAYYTLNDKNIFSGQIQHLYQDEDPFYSALLANNPFPGILPTNDNQDIYDINQQKDVITNKLDAKLDHYYVLNNTSNLNFTLGTTYSNQQFNSGIFQLLDNGQAAGFTNSGEIDGETFPLVNDVDYTFSDLFLGVRYKLKTGDFIISPGLTAHNYTLKNTQLGVETTIDDWRVLPDLNVTYNIKKSESLRFNYDIQAQYTDVNNYAEAFVFNNYNRLFRGNRNLQHSLSHNYNLSYFSFNMFNYTNVGGSINYSRRIENVKSISDIIGVTQVSSPFNISDQFPDETISANVRWSKQIKKMQVSVSGNASYNTSNNIINDEVRDNESFTQSYRTSLRSKFREWPNFEVGYRLSINDYNNGGIEQVSYTHRPFANVDINFLKNFSFHAEWDFYNYALQDNRVDNQYSFVDADLFYQQKDSPWEFKLQVTNVLDTEFINNDSFSDQFNTTSSYAVLPRIAMFIVKYNL